MMTAIIAIMVMATTTTDRKRLALRRPFIVSPKPPPGEVVIVPVRL
ncbi:Uncharacterised protein [Serratia quinivorans]|nr:Uncharacterised protein [Serratia quinivorans]